MKMEKNGTEIFTAGEISRRLHGSAQGLDIRIFDSLDSTNTRLRALAAQGAPHGTVVIARTQTAGRGRGDHRFFSPEGTGLYLSILLRPGKTPAHRLGLIGAWAAVAACRAIEEAAPGSSPRIKWVNDILIDGKKVCGILSEAALAPGGKTADFVVLGAGINVCPPPGGFPAELQAVAGSVLGAPGPEARAVLAAGFLNALLEGFELLSEPGLPPGYAARSLLIGRDILLRRPEGDLRARVTAIDEHCRLQVLREDGQWETLHTGPIDLAE